MYNNFQIVSGVFKDREIKQGLKLRPSFDQALEEDVENPMIDQYIATGVFKSQKFQNILNNDIENLDSLQRSKIRSDLLKRDLIDAGVDVHQAQEQAIRQVRQPIITEIQDQDIEGSLEEMYDALDKDKKVREESSSSAAAMVNRELIEQISKDYVNDLFNRMQTQIKTKEAPKEAKPEEVDIEAKPKSKKLFPPFYAGDQPSSSSSSAAAVQQIIEVPEEEPKEEEEQPSSSSSSSPQVDINKLLNLVYIINSNTIKKELEAIKNNPEKESESLKLKNLQMPRKELEKLGVVNLAIQAHHPDRKIKFEESEDDKTIKVSGINQSTNIPFKLIFKTKTGALISDNYVEILRAYDPYIPKK